MPKKKGEKDEENRLQAIDDNGFVSNYWYDAAGERTVKTSGESQQIYVNSVFSGGDTQTADFTAYVNPYLVVSKGGQYTKHIYIGSQRIVSKLGDLDSYGSDPRRIEYAGANVDGAKVDYATKYEALQQTIKDRYAAFEVPYYGKDNDDYVNGQGFCCDDTPKTKSFAANVNDNPELFQYYYHSDHLGSSSLITNLDGEIVQHIEYVPFGEVFIEERNSTWNTPYLFNAKELDEETGLYYYGARYYDPRVSQFLSADRFAEKYPNKTPYHYCSQNPINRIDPLGLTDYFNLKGDRVLRTNDGQTVARIVLTTKSKVNDINTAIRNNHVIDPLTTDEIDKIDRIYQFGNTDRTGIERGFMRGTNGSSSNIIEGITGEIGDAEWREARDYIINTLNENPKSDVHLHPLHYDPNGEITSYGLPKGSPTDLLPNNNISYTEPSIVLGWNRELEADNTFGNGSVSSIGGSSRGTYTYKPTIGFYLPNEQIKQKISWDDLKAAHIKMNNTLKSDTLKN